VISGMAIKWFNGSIEAGILEFYLSSAVNMIKLTLETKDTTCPESLRPVFPKRVGFASTSLFFDLFGKIYLASLVLLPNLGRKS
jgi:hypothetical protein